MSFGQPLRVRLALVRAILSFDEDPHLRIRPRRPQTNGKVERFIQTLLREWAYRFAYNPSEERKRWLTPYLHFYNFHRAHSALSYNAPISRLDRKNVVKRNS